MKVYFDQIYERMGCLFYAIASEKQKQSTVNIARLLQIIDEQWKSGPSSEAVLQSHLMGYLKSGVRNAVDNALQPGEAFDRFRMYFDLHSLPFRKDLRDKIIATAKAIAAELSGNGIHSEFINCLEDLFEYKTPERVIGQLIRK